MSKVKIKINGNDKEFEENSTIKEIVDTLEIKSKMFVVEKNLKIVEKEDYNTCTIEEGDSIEIVGFFGGG